MNFSKCVFAADLWLMWRIPGAEMKPFKRGEADRVVLMYIGSVELIPTSPHPHPWVIWN